MGKPQYDLYVITRNVPQLRRSHVDVAKAAVAGGVRFLQFREKEMTTREMVETAGELRRLTGEYGAVLVVNDRVDVALAVGADGVHLGEEDMPLPVARRLLGPTAIIGASVAAVENAKAAEAAGADYLGVGPVYATGSKVDAGEAVGCESIRQIRAAVGIPILGVGGVNADKAAEVIRAGADGVAVISAVSDAEDMVAATADLLQRIRGAREEQGLSGAADGQTGALS